MNNTAARLLKATAVLVLAAVTTYTLGATATQPAELPTQDMAAAAPLTSDLEGEVWWTTTDCPEGVDSPCIDPAGLEQAGIQEDDPRWDCRAMGNRVCGEDNGQGVPAGDYSVPAGEAEWSCFTDLGYLTDDYDSIQPTSADLTTCRQVAYDYVLGGEVVPADGCWVELDGEAVFGAVALRPAGAVQLPCVELYSMSTVV